MENQIEKPSSVTLTPDVVESFVKVTRAVSELTQRAHEVAKEGPTVSMLTYGPVLILGAVGLKVAPVDLQITEFSILVASGTLLFIASAVVRLYRFKLQAEIDREIRQQAYQTLQAQQTAAISAAQAQQTAAISAANTGSDNPVVT